MTFFIFSLFSDIFQNYKILNIQKKGNGVSCYNSLYEFNFAKAKNQYFKKYLKSSSIPVTSKAVYG